MKRIIYTLLGLCTLSNAYSSLQNDNYIVAKDRVITLNVAANDNLLTVCGPGYVHITPYMGVVTTQQGGSLVFNSDRTITYTPPTGFSGHDSFLYAASYAVGGSACDTARAFLWVLANSNCDPSYVPTYTYTVSSNNLLTVTSLGGAPSAGTLQTQKLYVDGNYINMSGGVGTFTIQGWNFAQHVFGIEEEWYNTTTGDTCLYYATDTVFDLGCDTNYIPRYTSTFGGDTITMNFDTITPSATFGYVLECRFITLNGVQVSGCNPVSSFTRNLSGYTNPVICIEEEWSPIGFEDTCIYTRCDTVSSTSTGVSELSIANIAFLYPNPVENVLTIKINSVNDLYNKSISILDISGKNVLYENIKGVQTKIDFSNLDKGTYIYLLRNEKGIIQSGKIIKK